ncbi:GTP pyrophosphokinase [Raoultella planticola]|uniref:GTP pyrophosphokinase n=1 Tax=Raoultella planticola TaxID=575 RepID=A0A485BQN6_RAOPL|nr:GTP pyrophosphokinase [Raoultella planticola]
MWSIYLPAPRRSTLPTISIATSATAASAAKISGRIVPFTYQLQMGDQIEIITQKQAKP